MPIYEYYCGNCDQKYESIQSMKDCSKPIDCPDCGGPAKRIISAPLIGTSKTNEPKKTGIIRDKPIITKRNLVERLDAINKQNPLNDKRLK